MGRVVATEIIELGVFLTGIFLESIVDRFTRQARRLYVRP